MSPERKRVREQFRNIRSSEDAAALLDSVNLTKDERDIARLILVEGWTYKQASIELGYSARQLIRRMNKVYRKLV